jgi:hypothetical protein
MRSFDIGAVFKAVWAPFVAWAVAVCTVAFGGHQPGVVCATPMAWLMALWVGLRCAAYTRTGAKSGRLTEAALSGSIFGLLQGVLFIVVVPFMGPIKPEEQQKAFVLSAVMLVVGSMVSAVLSLAIAASQERKRSVM